MTASPVRSLRGGVVLKLAVTLAILSAGLALAWMALLPLAVVKLVRARTGFETRIQSLYVNPFTARIAVRGMVISNPPSFPAKDFVDVREFRADARLASLFSRRWEVDDAALHLAMVAIERDQQGAVNTQLFQRGWAGTAGEPRPAAAPAPVPGKGFLIRHLEVRIDRLVLADYSQHPAAVREVNLNFHHTYENVTSLQQLAAPLADASVNLSRALEGVMPEFGSALRRAGDSLQETGRRAGDAVKSFFESLEKRLKK